MSEKRKRKKLIFFIVIFLIIFFGIIWYLYDKINSPSYGTISQPSNSSSNEPSFNLNPVKVSDKYVSFTYPQLMSTDKAGQYKYPTLDLFSYSYHDIETWGLNIMVQDSPNGSLSTNSAYLYRKQNPNEFSESKATVGGLPAIVMTDNNAGGFSKIAILVNGRYQATVSLVGDDPNGTQELQKVFDMVLNSWKWQNG